MSAKRCNLSWQTQWCWNDRNCCSHLKCFKMLWNALSRQSGVASSPRFLWIKNVFEQRNWRTLRKTFVFVISCLIPKKSLNCTSGQQYVAKIKYPPRLMFRVHSTHMKANVHLNVHPWLSIKKGAEKKEWEKMGSDHGWAMGDLEGQGWPE